MNDTNLRELRRLRSATDELAMIRTQLANERTFLAYVRTFIGAFGAGVGLIKLTDDPAFVGTGFGLAIIAPLILAVGLVRMVRTKRRLLRTRWIDAASRDP